MISERIRKSRFDRAIELYLNLQRKNYGLLQDTITARLLRIERWFEKCSRKEGRYYSAGIQLLVNKFDQQLEDKDFCGADITFSKIYRRMHPDPGILIARLRSKLNCQKLMAKLEQKRGE